MAADGSTGGIDSLYGGYLGAEHAAQSSVSSVPRMRAVRDTTRSMAETASVYTTATGKEERWSLEDGLHSPSVFNHSVPPLPAESAAQIHLHRNDTQSTGDALPYRGMANAHPFTKPVIAIQRSSETEPVLYDTFRSGVTILPEGFVRPQGSPPAASVEQINHASEIDVSSSRASNRGSLDSVREALAARKAFAAPGVRDSVAEARQITQEKLFYARPAADQPVRHERSRSDLFVLRNHGEPDIQSRFSEDGKADLTSRQHYRSDPSDADYQSTTWNLFGRHPNADPHWHQSGNITVSKKQVAHGMATRRRKRWLIILASLAVLAALGGCGAGIAVWRMKVAKTESPAAASSADTVNTAASASASASASSSPSTSATSPGSGGPDVSAAVNTPARLSSNVTAGSGGAGGYRFIAAFGSSYADNGHSRSDSYKSTLKTGNGYAGGRSTNGPVYVEYLASILGPTANESAAMFNYAFSGSSCNNSITKFDVPDLAQQVSTYLGNLGGSNSTVAATLKNKTLITVWSSMEEMLTVWQAALSANPSDPMSYASSVIQRMLSSISESLKWTIAADATADNRPDFALLTLPEGELLPQAASLAGNRTQSLDVLKNMTITFNNGLEGVAAALNVTKVHVLSTQGLFNAVRAAPTSYGLTNVFDACIAKNCTDVDAHMWYDGSNPTTAMHKLVANRLASTILSS